LRPFSIIQKIYLIQYFRLASTGKSPKAAEKAARVYFDDLNDIFEQATAKSSAKILAAYEKSKTDLAAFKALL
jgi:hypothetical protein